MDIVYKTTMLTQGGRSGQVQSEDGSFKLKLAVPTEMGGPGGAPNPEQLFAGAFAACFEHSVRHIARADKLLERARGICPYADAVKNNMTLNVKAVLDTPVAA